MILLSLPFAPLAIVANVAIAAAAFPPLGAALLRVALSIL